MLIGKNWPYEQEHFQQKKGRWLRYENFPTLSRTVHYGGHIENTSF